MTDEHKENFPWGLLILSVVAAALLRLSSLNLPLDRDEGEYASLAFAWLHGGGVPYRDFLEQKPPLAIFIYALPQLLGFLSVQAIRVTALIWQSLSVGALFVLGWRLKFDAKMALMAALLYAVLSSGVRTQGPSANAELFVSLPMVTALILSVDKRWLWFGILVGMASLAKQSALPAALVIPLALESGPWRERGKALARALGGAALPWFFCLLLFALGSAAGDFFNCVFSYNLSYASQGWAESFGRLYGVGRWILGEQGLLWLALPYAAWRAWKDGKGAFSLSLAWMLAALLGVSLSGRYYPHYFQIALAPLALLAALSFFSLEARWQKVLGWALLGLFGLQFLVCNGPFLSATDPSQRTLRLYNVESFAIAPSAADWINAQTPEAGRLWIWGSEAEIYFLSRRLPATRFLFNYPFTGEAPAWPEQRQQMEDALSDTRTQAVFLSEPLPDREMAALVLKNFRLRSDVAPPFMMGLRKP